MMVKSARVEPRRKAGRPPGQVPRPHIQIPGDELWPLDDIAVDFGVSTRTLKRNPDVAITYIGGCAYAKTLRRGAGWLHQA
jgi:hypothetical protein